MTKPVNERPADDFGNHKLDMDKLDYEDEKVKKAKKARVHADAIQKLYKNFLVIASDSNAKDMDGGFGTGLISCYFGGAKNQKEQELMLENWLTALVENCVDSGVIGKHAQGKHQHAYDLFAKLAGYYAFQFPDKVKDRFHILKGVQMENPKELKKEVIAKLKEQGIDIDDPNVEIIDGHDMNADQLSALLTMLGTTPDEALRKIKNSKTRVIEMGRLNLKSMTKTQKEDLATLLDINLDRVDKKNNKEKKMTTKKEEQANAGNSVNLIQIKFKPEFVTEGLIASQQGMDDLENFLEDKENIDNGVFEQMWDDDACWTKEGIFHGLDRNNDEHFKIAKEIWMHGRWVTANQVDVYCDIIKEEMAEEGKNGK